LCHVVFEAVVVVCLEETYQCLAKGGSGLLVELGVQVLTGVEFVDVAIAQVVRVAAATPLHCLILKCRIRRRWWRIFEKLQIANGAVASHFHFIVGIVIIVNVVDQVLVKIIHTYIKAFSHASLHQLDGLVCSIHLDEFLRNILIPQRSSTCPVIARAR
jgi:hypothetical protein